MGGKSIKAVCIRSSRHLFHLIGDPRLVVCDLDEPEPDIIVVPCAKFKDEFDQAAHAVPRAFWESAAARGAVLVLDASREGYPHTPERMEALHAFLAAVGFARDKSVYVTQDRNYAASYGASCPDPMPVLNYDFFIRSFFKYHEMKGARIYQRRLAAFQLRGKVRPKRFICLNGTERPTKVLFLLWLLKAGLWDSGYISWGRYGELSGRTASWKPFIWSEIDRTASLSALAKELRPFGEVLDGMESSIVGDSRRSPDSQTLIKEAPLDTPLPEHDLSWFTVVTETEMEGTSRVTEKPFRSLVNFQPSIILGNPGSLDHIRSFGFQTFDGYFNEDYDREPDLVRRFKMVCDEVQRVCRMNNTELRQRERGITETLKFNAHWGLTQLPAIYRDRMDVAFMDEILRLRGDQGVAGTGGGPMALQSAAAL